MEIEKTFACDSASADIEAELNPDANPDVNSDMNPDVNPDMDPDFNPDLNPDVNTDMDPDLNPDLNPGVNTDVNPDLNPDLNPDMNPDVNPDAEVEWRRRCRSSRPTDRTQRLRNRRFQAMQRLATEGEYFSDESMRNREPYLYHKYIGRYLTREDVHRQSSAAAAAAAAAAGGDGESVMSHFLTQHCVRLEENSRYEAAAAADSDNSSNNEEEDDDDGDDEAGGIGSRFLPDRKRQLLRSEFLALMQRRFLAGKDVEYFDYGQVDRDDDLDLSGEFERDEEDRYFDSEEPS
ncbi:hypothetical protein BOX15_Mlig023425g1 [Macrostomum lignano]|uniref:CCD97-like C-terminal domain-containing protein n=1 Tax=Macrostomum lignano TaxID=282301 RepID=A0A267H6Z0_9PLAT|nr:hypothetical protein BOX15_Mlig023425g1 [Macrostomum lignano]